MTSGYERFEEQTYRWFRSRPFAYLVLAVFVVDGVVRLADGRVARGVANITIGFGICFWLRKKMQEPPESVVASRRQWLRDHPVLGGLYFGGVLGAVMGALFFVTEEGPAWWAMTFWVGFGVLVGPLVVWRLRKRDDTSGGLG